MENPTGRLARWALELPQHKFTVKHRKGKYNKVADALSRQPLETGQLAQNNPSSNKECPLIKSRLEEIFERPEKLE